MFSVIGKRAPATAAADPGFSEDAGAAGKVPPGLANRLAWMLRTGGIFM